MNELKAKEKKAIEPLAISAAEAAKLMGISRSMVYDLAKVDGFPAFRVGNRVVISVKGLKDWIKQQSGGGSDGLEKPG